MEFISSNPKDAAKMLAQAICAKLGQGSNTLWLISGGSNISIASAAFRLLKEGGIDLSNLSVTLTDERFGPVGHKDSNWKQLEEAGFDFSAMKSFPVLKGESLEDTVKSWSEDLKKLAGETRTVIAQFGVGDDAHIAGVLPKTIGVRSKDIAEGYVTEKFVRITLTLEALKGVDIGYAFVFGESKKDAVEEIKAKRASKKEKPAMVLWDMAEAYLVTDQ
jgi:6-phosphogluconolactonase/glucosamine-6-phosphate isomerase/deaminase